MLVCVRGELETERDCYMLTLSSSDHSSTSFSFCWPAQPGVTEGCKPSICKLIPTLAFYLQLELQLEIQLTQIVCGTWLYNSLPSTCFLWASHLHRIQPVHRSVSSTGCNCFLIDGSVEGQYVTVFSLESLHNRLLP